MDGLVTCVGRFPGAIGVSRMFSLLPSVGALAMPDASGDFCRVMAVMRVPDGAVRESSDNRKPDRIATRPPTQRHAKAAKPTRSAVLLANENISQGLPSRCKATFAGS